VVVVVVVVVEFEMIVQATVPYRAYSQSTFAWHTWHRIFSFDQNPVSSLFFLFQQRIGSVSFGVSRRVLVGR
jgi:hypothetical protein